MARSSSGRAELPTTTEVADLWRAVVRAGGAIGFPVDAPAELVAEAAAGELRDVGSGRQELLVERDGGLLVGMVLVCGKEGQVFRHRAEVRKLIVHPGWQRGGIGRRLLARAVERARDLGFRQLVLATRGGTHLPEFYRRQGWAEVGRFPAALQVAPGDFRDEHWFQREL
ncbi:GNAT family N-acetyltransferase [Saccharopolyspora sp. 6V]|uniref:GNAT family N-acetyltransferase n=1 Tax=Saccharopolyspora sp. 6V TaxID=2877239 RepID=UPI001CD600BD|nr:GNAT family N-acetyltransferase [Saccharopolyspora sp. 6V]MCA1190670.1 GNAT family N-acetyltransferase [Saccharopolyspora sp. 6V]